MSKKGVSADEKRTRMLQLFYEKKQFYQLKDLEKIAPQEKGIIANSVKDVIQKLVDDGLVDTDKIGQSTYFWAFPSKAKNTKKRKLHELTEQYQESKKKLKIIEETIDTQATDKENSTEKNQILNSISDLQLERDELIKRLKSLKDTDPTEYKNRKSDMQVLKDAVNRWTDNIFNIRSWCKNKFFMESDVIDKQFGIPHDFEYLE